MTDVFYKKKDFKTASLNYNQRSRSEVIPCQPASLRLESPSPIDIAKIVKIFDLAPSHLCIRKKGTGGITQLCVIRSPRTAKLVINIDISNKKRRPHGSPVLFASGHC